MPRRAPRRMMTKAKITHADWRRYWMEAILTQTGKTVCTAEKPCRSNPCRPILGACMKCTAMYGNGCRMHGTAITKVHPRMAVSGSLLPGLGHGSGLARAVCCVAGLGAPARGAAVLRTVAATSPTTRTTSLAFVAPEFSREPGQQARARQAKTDRREAERVFLSVAACRVD